MKKITILLSLIFTLNVLFAQSSAEDFLLDSIYQYYWVDSTSNWLEEKRTEYIYNDSLKNTATIYSNWDNDLYCWKIYKRDTMTYTADGYLSIRQEQSWSNSTGWYIWEANIKEVYSSYSSPKSYTSVQYRGFSSYVIGETYCSINSIKSYSNAVSSNFGYSSGVRTDFLYDNNITYRDNYTWGPYGDMTYAWKLSSKYRSEKFLNKEGKDSIVIDSKLNFTDSIWYLSSKREYVYDEYNNNEQIIYSVWDTLSSSWVFSTKEIYFWSETELAVNEINYLEISRLYPNPTTSNINITTTDNKPFNVEIINLNGQRMYSNTFNSVNTNITLPNISKGVYFVNIQNEDGVKTEKLVVE